MRYLFELQHPKHYHQFKHLIALLKARQDEVLIVARDKDVLLSLLQYDKHDYQVMGKHGKGIFTKFLLIPKLIFDYYKIIRHFKPHAILSKASPYSVVIGKFLHIPTIITPDSEVVALTNKFTAPLATCVITQDTFQRNFGKKHRKINGFFEATYLHPNYFKADENEIYNDQITKNDRIFVLRFIGWNANHDVNQYGFSQKEKIELVHFLMQHGKVIITSEKNVPQELWENVIKIHPSKIHHLLKFAHLYIGDSQSMATEASLLGTPSIRYNSFVGPNDVSNFLLLQSKYKLLNNCKSFNQVLFIAEELIMNFHAKRIWTERSDYYFQEIGDPNLELLSIIDNILKKI
jgi:hypothetical protein